MPSVSHTGAATVPDVERRYYRSQASRSLWDSTHSMEPCVSVRVDPGSASTEGDSRWNETRTCRAGESLLIVADKGQGICSGIGIAKRHDPGQRKPPLVVQHRDTRSVPDDSACS